MSINLEKKVAAAKIQLEKHDIHDIPCEVGLLLDASGSMHSDYVSGSVQTVIERVLAIAMNVDIDKKVDTWLFDTGVYPCETVTPDIIEDYVNNHAMSVARWGYTSYYPALKMAVDHLLPEKKSGFWPFRKKSDTAETPVLLLHITDGMCDDINKTESFLKSIDDKNVYLMFVGVGDENFELLKRVADKMPNCGFMNMSDLTNVTDEEVYEGILNEEFADWVKRFKS